LRVSAKKLLQSRNLDQARAETLLLRALDVARQQGALSWELRSAMTLAELWESQDRNQAAIDLVARLQARFTEGFATADFAAAASQLKRLRAYV
jgi:predicted ATPase